MKIEMVPNVIFVKFMIWRGVNDAWSEKWVCGIIKNLEGKELIFPKNGDIFEIFEKTCKNSSYSTFHYVPMKES